ncbi:TonB-dependent siderophore receptor [Kerstersia gyiorum]|uniref:TonB-dependent siderophore receptor n=1 Tax=Kerstersia gyiorum TaxID=206506 RepID=UPI000A0454ED|nr:TonB-dependent receptor [Kerstersia gyiorum]
MRNHPSLLVVTLIGCASFSVPAAAESGSTAVDTATNAETATVLPAIEVTGSQPEDDKTTNYTVRSNKSATRLDLSLKETPQSVTVMTQKQMEDQNLTIGLEALEQMPGVVVEQHGVPGIGKVSYHTRGFQIMNFQIDDVPIRAGSLGPDMLSAFDTGIYESVDMVRGSTGMTSGIGDPSASISFRRKRPTDDFQANAGVSYGSWERYRAHADLSGPLNTAGSLRGRLIAIQSGGKHWVDRVETESTTLYGIVEADLTPATTLALGSSFSYQHSTNAAPVGPVLASKAHTSDRVLFTHFDRSYNPATQWTYSDAQYVNSFAELRHHFNDRWDARLNYAYSDIDTDNLYGALGAANYSDAGFNAFYDPENDLASMAYAHRKNDGRMHNLDLTVSGNFDAWNRTHKLVLGLSGYDGDLHLPKYGSFASPTAVTGAWNISKWNDGYIPLPRGSCVTSSAEVYEYCANELYFLDGYSDLKERSWGALISTQLSLTDRLKMVLGTRYSQWKRDYSIYRLDTNELRRPPYRTDVFYEESSITYRDDGKFVPYAGVLFDLTPQVLTYLSYTGIHKPHTDPYTMFDMWGKPLPAIKGNTIELGLNAGFFDDTLNLHFALYRMKQENLACEMSITDYRNLAPGEYPKGYYVPNHPLLDGFNITPSSPCDHGMILQGGEMSLSGRLTPRWMISASYSYAHTKNGEYGAATYWDWLADGSLVQRGSQGAETYKFPYAYNNPEHLFKLFTSYDLTDRLTLGGSVVWRSKTVTDGGFSDVSNDPAVRKAIDDAYIQDAFAVVDLMARYRLNSHFTLGINASNIFDKVYRVNGYGSFYGTPRSVVASVNYRF